MSASRMGERSALEVFLAFLKLGVMSFGGPIAHLGYFRSEFVVRRRWLDDPTYTDLVALCQFLPGPASSQVGFSLGLMRAGYRGGLAAWVGFTLPSAILMTMFAALAGLRSDRFGTGLLHGLKLVAVAIVAQAVWGMARSLCPDRQRATIAGVAALSMLFSSSSMAQVVVILMGGIGGLWLCRAAAPSAAPSAAHSALPAGSPLPPVSRRVGLAALTAYALGLLILPSWSGLSLSTRLFNAFYRAGALVFGGGHVVLPLLSNAFVGTGWVSNDSFLAGYGAAQALPGPLFTFAAFLGAVAVPSPPGIIGASLGIVGIFLPGMLVLLGALPFWEAIRRQEAAQASLRGVNAAVVGLLGAALYNPLWTGSVKSAVDFAIVLGGFVLLSVWRTPPVVVVILGALAGLLCNTKLIAL